ncbi:hypothetical protein OU798_05090 [Prolixibacteraceae bacterium Z1-6]|uniref:Uncharacterized protein n=1 Tax=Draconibacterium aestuarii TaxID=2998507 RepID=A0A9X3FB66_9BACT|nr:hypothetical protein [Prolixibacteraceae bacterium Z1-6]
MILTKKIQFIVLLSLLYVATYATEKDCEITFFVQNEKQTYTINDTIIILVKVRLDKDFCDEAADATKVFSKGLKIEERSEWKRLSDDTVGQKLVLTVLPNYENRIITVYRKTGHYSCFQQLEINLDIIK